MLIDPQASARLHPILVRAVVQALMSIFKDNRYADKVIETTLKSNPKAGSHDRAFIAETTYEIVRYFRLYTELLGKTPETELDFWKIFGIHQIVSTSSIVSRKAASLAGSATGLPPWIEFKDLHPNTILQQASKLVEIRKFRESIPDWLDELGAKELGPIWDETLHSLNQPARVVIRANRIKTDRLALLRVLQQEGVETSPMGSGDALVLKRRQNVFITKAFRSGLFEVQDFSSQMVAPLLAPEPGMRVVDACAGGGGKSLHLAAMMQNKGNLIALDTVDWKLHELKTRARRAGVSNIETRTIDTKKVVKRLYNSADRLLLDVPCSGLGVLRRNPDAKWKTEEARLSPLRDVQQEILRSYAPILKDGGKMVYATCSILPSENQEQVRQFLSSESGKGFTLLEEKSILPQDLGFDGFYMALIQKTSA
jgi:16S rRNA (cytosine967-C5)-methyltransferase